MKILHYLFALLFLMMLTSCELAGSIFEAGIWTGILAVVAIVGLIIWLIGRTKK